MKTWYVALFHSSINPIQKYCCLILLLLFFCTFLPAVDHLPTKMPISKRSWKLYKSSPSVLRNKKFFISFPQIINNSERPVDALAEKHQWLTDWLTTWNQEMLAHLKIHKNTQKHKQNKAKSPVPYCFIRSSCQPAWNCKLTLLSMFQKRNHKKNLFTNESYYFGTDIIISYAASFWMSTRERRLAEVGVAVSWIQFPWWDWSQYLHNRVPVPPTC